jgi:hypothetical protein
MPGDYGGWDQSLSVVHDSDGRSSQVENRSVELHERRNVMDEVRMEGVREGRVTVEKGSIVKSTAGGLRRGGREGGCQVFCWRFKTKIGVQE